MANTEKKQQLIKEFRDSDQDTGSAQIQIALLSERINQLNKHFELFPQDYASRSGLMKLVGRRRRLIRYLEGKNKELYSKIVTRLGLRD